MKKFLDFNFQLSNAGKRFLIELVLIALFFAIAGLSKLVGQDCRDPLGYSIESGKGNMVYIVYNPDPNRPYQKDQKIILDSVYINSEAETVYISPDVLDNLVSKLYFCSDGKELLVYTTNKKKRSIKKWPQVNLTTYRVYGKIINNTLFLKEKSETNFFRKGWKGLIINICILLSLAIAWFVEKRKDIKSSIKIRSDLNKVYSGAILLVVYLFFSILVAIINGMNLVWVVICLGFSIFVLLIQTVINRIYKKVLNLLEEEGEKSKKKSKKSSKSQN